MLKKAKNNKVVCALSGGVDSAVSAALLKETDDFKVTGLFMKLWDNKSSRAAELRARLIAKTLRIPFSTIDFRKKFKAEIIDYFLENYQRGITPNPCVVCNKKIKFGLMFDIIYNTGADFLATGHYARVQSGKGSTELLRARDQVKDQSYFLWKLGQKQLNKVLFPIGGYKKSRVKKMARDFNLPAEEIPESQEICFIEEKSSEFLKKHLKIRPGRILDKEGNALGQHEGLWFYTIGQRKGIKVPGGPFYVIDKDLKSNNLIVSRNEKDLCKSKLFLKNINWIKGSRPELPIEIKAKIRYRHKAASAILSITRNHRYVMEFKRPQRAVTPGQSAVFYDGIRILGGGEIV